MNNTPSFVDRYPLRVVNIQRVVGRLQLNERPLVPPLKVGHSLQKKGVALVVRNAIAEPAEEWAYLGCVKVVQVSLKVFTLLRNPDSYTEPVGAAQDG